MEARCELSIDVGQMIFMNGLLTRRQCAKRLQGSSSAVAVVKCFLPSH